MNYGINAWQGTRSVDCVDETSIPLTLKHQGGGGYCAYGLSLDGGFNFPTMRELCETLIVGTASGHYRAVIQFELNEERKRR